eukprot:scaffold26907_cov72-Phaeocystis_antarctica.AAC.1
MRFYSHAIPLPLHVVGDCPTRSASIPMTSSGVGSLRRYVSVFAPASERVHHVPHRHRRWRLRRPAHMDRDHIAGRSAHRPRMAGVERQVGGRTRTVAGARDVPPAVGRGAAPRVRRHGVRPAAQHGGMAACGATVHGTFGTPEAGTRTPYVQCVTPRGKLPCASGTYSMQEAGTRSSYVQYGGPGTPTVKTAVVGSCSSWSQCSSRYGSGGERKRNVSSTLDTCGGRSPPPPAEVPCSRSSSPLSAFSKASVRRVNSRRAGATAGGGASSKLSSGSTSKPRAPGSASSSDVLHSTGDCRRAICRPRAP